MTFEQGHSKIGDTYSFQMISYFSSENSFGKVFEKRGLESFSFKRLENSITITPFIGYGFAAGNHEVDSNLLNREGFVVEARPLDYLEGYY